MKLIEDIIPQPFGACLFDGRIYRPGAAVDVTSLPRPAVLIECAGPIGVHRRGKHRDYLYLLWRFDFSLLGWVKIAEAQAKDASWTAAIREAAWRALYPRPELFDIVERSRNVTEELLATIDRRLRAEELEVQANTLHALYDRVAGRIAACAPLRS